MEAVAMTLCWGAKRFLGGEGHMAEMGIFHNLEMCGVTFLRPAVAPHVCPLQGSERG